MSVQQVDLWPGRFSEVDDLVAILRRRLTVGNLRSEVLESRSKGRCVHKFIEPLHFGGVADVLFLRLKAEAWSHCRA